MCTRYTRNYGTQLQLITDIFIEIFSFKTVQRSDNWLTGYNEMYQPRLLQLDSGVFTECLCATQHKIPILLKTSQNVMRLYKGHINI